jgi:hypothetical protein
MKSYVELLHELQSRGKCAEDFAALHFSVLLELVASIEGNLEGRRSLEQLTISP